MEIMGSLDQPIDAGPIYPSVKMITRLVTFFTKKP